jgi:hypothetical protein
MVFSLEHDIKATKNHQNLLPTQSVLVAHTVLKHELLFFLLVTIFFHLHKYKYCHKERSKRAFLLCKTPENICGAKLAIRMESGRLVLVLGKINITSV